MTEFQIKDLPRTRIDVRKGKPEKKTTQPPYVEATMTFMDVLNDGCFLLVFVFLLRSNQSKEIMLKGRF